LRKLLLIAATLWAGPASDLARELRTAGLDPEECYRVREVHFTRGDDLRFYLIDGWLIFGKPVGGRRLSAVFTTDTDGGDAELLVLPPDKGERTSLAAFAGTPNLDEHFRSALFLFTDDSAEALMKAVRARGEAQKSPERGLLLAQEWNSVLANISGSFAVRLLHHLMEGVPAGRGVFYSALQGRQLGNFDAVYDPESPEQIYLGQLKYKDDRAFYDTWTSFPATAYRHGQRQIPDADFTAPRYRIEAALDPDLNLRVTTRVTVVPARNGVRTLLFDISEGMKVNGVQVDGAPAEVFDRESFRADLIRRPRSRQFFVVTPQTLTAGRECEVTFEHEGQVVRPAGRNVFYVGSRGNWYPRGGLDYSLFDISFTYPGHLDLLFPGELREERSEGTQRWARRVTPAPIRIAGFNLGQYEKAKAGRGELQVEVYANRQAEFALTQRRLEPVIIPPPPSPFPRQRGTRQPEVLMPSAPPLPDPTARLHALAEEIASGFDFLASNLGPPAVSSLKVSPIPGAFGQGFPGLVYLSTIAYLDPQERPATVRNAQQQLFFSELLHAHEVAHQWWGNVVTAAGPSDEWLMEALANYSALLVLERKKGAKAVQAALQQYKERLLQKDADGRTVESAGPIRLGTRLSSSQSPDAWHHIVYGKGSWVLHMLRKRVGDGPFLKLLGEVCTKYRSRPVSAAQFQEMAAAYLPRAYAESFFDHWVESTGVPEISMSHVYKPGRLIITVTQSGLDENAVLQVPVDVQVARAKPQTHWVTTGSDPAVIAIPLRAAPLKVTLDPESAVLRR
jgi:hypothetical protein